MSSGIPGKIIVNEFSLLNNLGEKNSVKTNIWPMVVGTSIYESIFRENMWGVAKIQDSYNLYNTLPITTNTYLKVSLTDPTTGKTIRSMFRIYKISDIQQSTTKLQTYVIHFVSNEMYNSQYIRISKHIKGNIPKEIADIHKQISNKKIEITEDAAKTNIYLPYMTAEQAIKLLVNNAKWKASIPDYCYWETFNNYNCKSLSSCLFENQVHDFSTSVVTSTKIYDDFGYQDFIKINDVNVKTSFDGIETLYKGWEGNTIYTYDPIAGQSTANSTGDHPLSRIYNFADNSLDYSTLSVRMQILRSISQSYYYISVPGLLSRSSGDNANVTIYNGNNLDIKDEQLSGRRLICGIVHMINLDQYTQHITLGDYYLGN